MASRETPRTEIKRLYGRFGDDMLNKWDEFADNLPQAMMARAALERPIPTDTADAFLKMGVYRFVVDLLLQKKGGVAHAIFDEAFYETRGRAPSPLTPKFKDNPFHWAFMALRDPARDVESPKPPHHLTRDDVSKFGRQLNYAYRHSIPEELLIGFIHQSGGPDEISAKEGRGSFEHWYHKRRGSIEKENSIFGRITARPLL
jgi:hypothetical protein